MTLVIEGPDMVGKTTLCTMVVQHLRTMLADKAKHSLGQAVPRVTADHFTAAEAGYTVEQYVDRMHQLHVRDRMHISERLYGLYHRGTTTMSAANITEVEKELHVIGGMVVLLVPDMAWYTVHAANVQASREEAFSVQDNIDVAAAYGEYACRAAVLDIGRSAEQLCPVQVIPVIGPEVWITPKLARGIARRYLLRQMHCMRSMYAASRSFG